MFEPSLLRSGDAPAVGAPPACHGHAVQFYDSDDDLAELASAYLATGLAARQPAVAFTTAPHREVIRGRLRERGFEVDGLEGSGRLRFVDAHETLRALLRDDMPDADRFAALVGAELARATAAGSGRVCAFGEMVDVLWRAGNPRGALRLEELWNAARDAHEFDLLCAYAMACFADAAAGGAFARVCEAHDHARPTMSFLRIDGEEARNRAIAALEQRARALEHEVALRRAAEGELRGSEQRFRQLVDLLPAAVYACEAPSGVITFFNQHAATLWGRAPRLCDVDERFCGSLRLHRADGAPLPHAQTPMAVALREGRAFRNQDVVIERPDGSRIHVLANIDPIRDAAGQVVGALNVFHDTTELKSAQDALRGSEARLAAELEAITRLHALSSRLLSVRDLPTALDDILDNAIATTGADFGAIQLLDPETHTLSFAAQRGLDAGFVAHFATVRADDGSACARALRAGARVMVEDVAADAGFAPHLALVARAGFRAVQSTPLVKRDGTVLGMLSTHFRAPHRLSARDERLLDLYARNATDLVERLHAEQALQDAGRRKDEFLATLAHELRNPLAPLRNALELMAMAPGDVATLRDARAIMRRQLDHLVRLVDDLLDLSRISRDKLHLRRGRFHLRHLLDCALETSRPLLEAGRHPVSVAWPDEPVVMDADATRITQVFANLLNNAAKFSPAGAGIEIEVRADGPDAVIAVRDHGVGIAADMLPRLFEMFTQAAVPGEGKGGLGIGLTLARRLTEMHGGSIGVDSPGLGLGSTFTVRLPRAAGTADTAVAPPWPGMARVAPQSILIADDNVDAADSLARLLRMAGHDVHIAHDGLQAVQAATDSQPGVVLLDLGMPRLNGYEAARQIRAAADGRCPLLIAVTGWGQESDRRRSKEAGFDLHLVKPIDFGELQEVLRRRRE